MATVECSAGPDNMQQMKGELTYQGHRSPPPPHEKNTLPWQWCCSRV